MKKVLFLLYGLISYALFFGTFLYAIGFIGNLWVPKTLDGPATVPFSTALAINLGLLTIFAIQHSVMARPGFKSNWTRIVPQPIERSTYVLFSSVCLIAMFIFWQPMGGIIWEASSQWAIIMHYSFFALGWLLVLVSTFLINHFDLFGLRQVWMYFQGKAYEPLKFRIPSLYKLVRHPLYLGWLLAFWFTPTMTFTHLLFAGITTAYIFVAIRLEENDLIKHFGDLYVEYKKTVPMIFPIGKRASDKASGQYTNQTN